MNWLIMALALVQVSNLLKALEVAMIASFMLSYQVSLLSSQKNHESGLGMQFSCKVLPTVFKTLGLFTSTTKKQNYHGQTDNGSSSSISNRRF